jgi:hypothetical protein
MPATFLGISFVHFEKRLVLAKRVLCSTVTMEDLRAETWHFCARLSLVINSSSGQVWEREFIVVQPLPFICLQNFCLTRRNIFDKIETLSFFQEDLSSPIQLSN